MNPMRSNLLLPLFFIIILFIFGYLRNRQKIETFIGLTWFKRRSKIYQFRKLLYIVGVSFLLSSLLDFRGPEEKVESDIPDQKTIIIIDSSASMLAEDVRPNRFKKALIMSRHFVKKAFGHKIAVVLFSDQQKRLVPFTDDLDLLDARLAGLESIDLYDGGSNISQAIKESLGYFKTTAGNDTTLAGNILVFTDSEGHDEDFALSLPKTITLGVVAVGTLKGARIPHRDRNGVFRGYKKYKGKEVISKLNEVWLKGLLSKVSNYKYWVANSYTIPTEEIISFFNSSFKKRMSKGLTTIRPVKVGYVLIPGMIILIISFLLYPMKSFKLSLIFIPLLCVSVNVKSASQPIQEQNKELSKEELAKLGKDNKQLNELMDKHKQGLLDRNGKMKMAELLMDHQSYDMASTIYEESTKEMTGKDKNNYAINLIKNKQTGKAIQILSDLQLKMKSGEEVDKELKKAIRQNMLLALVENRKQQNKNKNKKKQEQKNKKKKKEKQKNQKTGKGKSGENKKDNKEYKPDDKEKLEKKKNDKNNKNKDEKNQKKKHPRSLKDKQKDIERKRKMVKIPGLIKQLMSDDRSLQKKYIDTSTDKQKSFNKKDW